MKENASRFRVLVHSKFRRKKYLGYVYIQIHLLQSSTQTNQVQVKYRGQNLVIFRVFSGFLIIVDLTSLRTEMVHQAPCKNKQKHWVQAEGRRDGKHLEETYAEGCSSL